MMPIAYNCQNYNSPLEFIVQLYYRSSTKKQFLKESVIPHSLLFVAEKEIDIKQMLSSAMFILVSFLTII